MLPNNKNVILSAEQAAALASKPVRVIPSRSVQAGLAAMVRYLPSNSAEENERADARGARRRRDRRGDGGLAGRRAERRVACARAATSASPTETRSPRATNFDEVAGAVVERLLATAARR